MGLIVSAIAQEHPPVLNYTPDIYGADNQNWMLSQDADKSIYVANNKGLLVFNGSHWQLYPSPNETVMRGVKAVDDKVYTGAYMDFGVWTQDSSGVLYYDSISNRKGLAMIEDEHIWNIESYRQYVLFQSLDRIYIYDTENDQVQVITPKNKIFRLFLVEEELFFQVKGEGIYSIEQGEPVLYSNTNVFKENRLINLFRIEGSLIGITATKGFYTFNQSEAKAWSKVTNKLLDKINVYSAIIRQNGSIVLGTIENGVLQLSNTGEMEYQIKKGTGLNNNTALALMEDVDQNLWVGLDAGIDCVNRLGPFNQYIDKNGALGTIYSSIVFEDYIYLGTNQGLFCKKINTDLDFKRIPNTEGQVWDLSLIHGALFCGHNNGTFSINKEKARLIGAAEGTWDLKEIPGRSDLLLQGNYDGLYILEKVNGNWRIRNKIQDFVISSKHFEMVDVQTILVNHEYKGVYEIKVDSNYQKALNVIENESVAEGEHSSLARLGETIFYANKSGIYTYNEEEKNFQQEKSLSNLFTNATFVTGKLIEDDNTLWAFTKDNLISITRDKLDGSYGIKKLALPSNLRNTVEGYESFVRFRESDYLLGTSNGYIIVDIKASSGQEYNINLNEVRVRNLAGESKLVPVQEEGDFPSKLNNLRFTYSVPVYDKFRTAEYTYKLEGLYEKWSPLTTNAYANFENLPSGSYNLRIKAFVGGVETLNEITYPFIINRPWYLSNTAIVLYCILAILLFAALNWFYKRYYKRQQEMALDRSKRDMELKALESEKQIIQLNNANLKQDIDARNRELAVSTMNMISKSKALNTIKSALLKVSDVNDVKKIIGIVDNTLESEDDWNFFEKAFNHADKDFFRKVKEKHPSLTANDLKLCVYLRLNMSSKEIAPLLNISSRSVEIKRYRLRKKLDLSREVNLNDYFIDL